MIRQNLLVTPKYALLNLEEIQVPEGKSKVEISVPEAKGLKLVKSRQSLTWLLRYGYEGKKESKVLGKYPDISLEDAIHLTLRYQAQLAKGINPFAEMQKQAAMPTLKEFFEKHYFPHAKQNKKSWKDDQSRFTNHLQETLGAVKIDQISPAMLTDTLAQVKESGCINATVNRTRALLSSILKMAFDRELIGQNPMMRVKKYVEKNQIERYLSEDELKRLMPILANPKAYGIENQIIIGIVEMLLLTGARKGEVLHLKWADLDLSNHLWKLNENKSGKPRIIQLNTEAQRIVRGMSRKHEYVFANPETGQPFNDIRKTFQKILNAADIQNFRIHDLHHNFASMAVNNGCDIYVVQHLLGHASPTTTQRYAHLQQDTLRNASELLANRINRARPDQAI
ncbi:site-specific integrase [Acinetobacter sp. SH20PTE14]|uniref:site-specific integrase n=1 Tax=Acinetobacter sp. SH20PTE14 TaxID=2905879 RepID=UPI001F371BB6|nr:site-specific integrase [Acinetobacter sp. SH20PTE14]UIJ77447.1 tyrosine-type recombinase/integrase [Acinetobacter sp. SH20PTE14]